MDGSIFQDFTNELFIKMPLTRFLFEVKVDKIIFKVM